MKPTLSSENVKMNRMKVAVAISGGVDSAYALYKLKEEGHEVKAFHLILGGWSDVEGAKEVARVLNVDLELIDLKDEFEKLVIDYFVREYESGRTPNPCYFCNRKIKFGIFLEIASKMGFDRVATGHYARVENGLLYRALDKSKDQSYFLSSLSKDQLRKVILPLGNEFKRDVKEKMEKLGVVRGSESQDVCFLQGKSVSEFLEKRLGRRRGYFIDENGNILGEHEGYYKFTIGQRRGLGVSSNRRLYVKEIKPESGDVVLSGREGVLFDSMIVEDLNVISHLPDMCQVKVRSNFKPVDCTVRVKGNRAFVRFAEKVFAVTPGQIAVFYEGDLVLASGVIARYRIETS